MRYFLPVILVLLLAGWAQGATYYVAPDGDDMMAGTSAETAWETIDRLNAQTLVAGDTVILGGTAKNPLRGSLILNHAGAEGNPITTSGGYLAASIDVTDGSTYEISNARHVSWDGWFQEWTTTTDSTTWGEYPNGTSTVNQDTVNQLSGDSCLRFDIDADNSLVYIRDNSPYISAGTGYFTITYKTSATGVLKFDLQKYGTGLYMQADGSFDAALYRPDLPSSETWTTYTSPTYTLTNHAELRFQLFGSGASQSVYVQAVRVFVQPVWEVHDGDIYKVSLYSDQASPMILKTSTWDTDGLDGLEFVPLADSLAEIGAGEFFRDGTNHIMYYRLASGETFEDLHFEVTWLSEGINITADYNNLSGISQYAANGHGVYTEGAIANFSDMYVSRSALYNVKDSVGSTTTWTDSKFYKANDTQHENVANGYLNSGATSTMVRCESSYNGDDGFQVTNNGTLNMYYCISHNNLSQQLTVTSGGGNFYNNIFYDGLPERMGIAQPVTDKTEDGTARVYYNNFVLDVRIGDSRAFGIVNATGITESNNGWFGGANPPDAPYGETNGLNVDPGFDNDFNTTALELLKGGAFISGFHSTYEEDFDGTYLPPYRIPIGAQGFAPVGNLRWGKIYGRH